MATLVTGGAGYIGSHTAVALHAAGRDVVLLDDFSNAAPSVVDAVAALAGSRVPVIEGDAADPQTLQAALRDHPIDSIVHLAARKSVAESVADPLGYYRSNLGSTIAVAQAAVDGGIRRVVFSSSATVYGSTGAAAVTEASPTAPENPYGATKLMGERIMADAAAAATTQVPPTVVVLRYFNPVGAHRSAMIGEDPLGEPANLVPRIMNVAAGRTERLQVYGSDYATSDGTTIRDYIHVMDLAEGHVAALSVDISPYRSRVFNLGTGTGTSVLQLLGVAEEVVGAPIAHEFAPRRPGDVESSWADCTRAASELGWRARRGLRQMLEDHWRFVSAKGGRSQRG